MSVHMVEAKIKRESVTDVEASLAAPAIVQPLTVIGSYRLF